MAEAAAPGAERARGAEPGAAVGSGLLVTFDFPPLAGGVQTWMERVARDWPGGRVAVLAADSAGAEAYDAGAPFRVLRAGRALRPLAERVKVRKTYLPALVADAVRAARRLRPDVVVAGDLAAGLAAAPAARAAGSRLAIFVHGRDLTHPVMGRLSAPSARLADRVFANSHFTAGLVRARIGARADVRLVHPGVDPGLFRPLADREAVRARLGWTGRRVALSAGRLVFQKGQDTTIRAVARLREAIPDILYVVIGAGPEEARLRALAAGLGLAGQVQFLGRVPHPQLPPYLGAADAFVMPSRWHARGWESFGIVYVEASACGVPVVAAATGGTPDAVRDGETGLLIRDPGDVAELADVLGRVLTDTALAARLGRAGRAFAAGERSWDASLALTWRALAGL